MPWLTRDCNWQSFGYKSQRKYKGNLEVFIRGFSIVGASATERLDHNQHAEVIEAKVTYIIS